MIYGACKDFHVGTYNLESIKSTKGFKHIRFVLKESCSTADCINKHYFATSGVDFYGTLYTFNNHCSCSHTHIINIFVTLSLIKRVT